MLLRLDSIGPRGFFTEVKELADTVPELGKLLKSWDGEIRSWSSTSHIYIVSRYI